MSEIVYNCDICSKDFWEPSGLQIIQYRWISPEDGAAFIFSTVVCEGECADRTRTDEGVEQIYTDEPYVGR